MTDQHATEHMCPRRAEAPYQFPGPDRWEDRASLAGGIGPSCSYCGSLPSNRFLELVRDGWVVGPTDKNYKAYLTEPVTDELRAERKTRWSNSPVGHAVREAALAAGASETEADAIADEHWRTHEEPYLSGRQSAKFYFQHLSPKQQTEFIELYNTKRMVVGYPGRFYARPYFCGTGEGQR